MGVRQIRRLHRAALVAIAALSLGACSASLSRGNDSGSGVESDGATSIGAGDLAAQLDSLPTAELSEEQSAGLLQMREEEKLAHDVYIALAGQFANADLGALYTSFVAQGRVSLVDALIVGATIKDLDIADLKALDTNAPDIMLVYSNLERGSRNHLRAFTKQLVRNGASYTPIHISQADYDAIISTGMERNAGA
jgi:hypothetical protein